MNRQQNAIINRKYKKLFPVKEISKVQKNINEMNLALDLAERVRTTLPSVVQQAHHIIRTSK